MSCTIYILDLNLGRRYEVGQIRKHTEMSTWLHRFGDPNFPYEIWKHSGLHSRWIMKYHGRWGRTPTTKVDNMLNL